MIYVLTADRRQFQSFLQEFHLREHHGQGGNKEGQCRMLRDADDLRGIDSGIVLTWGTPHYRSVDEVRAHCRHRDIPVLEVPDLRRERYYREQAARPAPRDRGPIF